MVKDRNPAVLWKVLNELVRENSEFEKYLEIKLVGKVDLFVKEQIQQFALTKYLKIIDYLPHSEVIIEQKKSKVLLLLVNNTKNAEGILTGKFYEYMSANVPVLAIGPVKGDLATQITETGVGLISGFEDEISLKKNILDLFSGKVLTRSNEAVQSYSRKNLTGKLADLLNKLN